MNDTTKRKISDQIFKASEFRENFSRHNDEDCQSFRG